MPNSKYETELRLIVAGRDQLTVVEEIAAIDRVGNYLLLKAGTKKIHDIYFDTRDGQLSKENFGLRIRKLDDKLLVTLKGKPESLPDGSVIRLEEEFPWGEEAREFILNLFSKIGIEHNGQKPPSTESPQDFLESFGLNIIHQRFNSRQLRNIVNEKSSDSVLLEMAIDQMTFPFGAMELKLFEIELEQKHAKGGEVTNFLKNFLQDKFGDKLLLWRHSKLATGIAIQRLIRDDTFLTTIDSEGYLCERSYKLIKEYFLKNKIGVS